MSIGTLVAFITLVSMLIWPVRQMGRILSELGKAMVALGRIQEILNEPEESQPRVYFFRVSRRYCAMCRIAFCGLPSASYSNAAL